MKKSLGSLIAQWLAEHPDATPQQAIWAGARIEIELWCGRHNDNP